MQAQNRKLTEKISELMKEKGEDAGKIFQLESEVTTLLTENEQLKKEAVIFTEDAGKIIRLESEVTTLLTENEQLKKEAKKQEKHYKKEISRLKENEAAMLSLADTFGPKMRECARRSRRAERSRSTIPLQDEEAEESVEEAEEEQPVQEAVVEETTQLLSDSEAELEDAEAAEEAVPATPAQQAEEEQDGVQIPLGRRRKRWTEAEDELLIEGIKKFGKGEWALIRDSFFIRSLIKIQQR